MHEQQAQASAPVRETEWERSIRDPNSVANNGQHARTPLGTFDGYVYARGRYFVVRRLVDRAFWSVFCGADAWPIGAEAREVIAEQLRAIGVPDVNPLPALKAAAIVAGDLPDDLALLRDARAREAGIAGKSASSRLRQALQVLNMSPLISVGGGLATYSIEDVDAIREPIEAALEQIEGVADATVLTAFGAQSLTEFMATLAEEHGR
jgi:hypothetical protein